MNKIEEHKLVSNFHLHLPTTECPFMRNENSLLQNKFDVYYSLIATGALFKGSELDFFEEGKAPTSLSTY